GLRSISDRASQCTLNDESRVDFQIISAHRRGALASGNEQKLATGRSAGQRGGRDGKSFCVFLCTSSGVFAVECHRPGATGRSSIILVITAAASAPRP